MAHIKVVEEEANEGEGQKMKTMKTCFEQLSTGKLKVWRCQLVGSVKLPARWQFSLWACVCEREGRCVCGSVLIKCVNVAQNLWLRFALLCFAVRRVASSTYRLPGRWLCMCVVFSWSRDLERGRERLALLDAMLAGPPGPTSPLMPIKLPAPPRPPPMPTGPTMPLPEPTPPPPPCMEPA